MLSQSDALVSPAISPRLAGRLVAASAPPNMQTRPLPAWQAAARAAYMREFGASDDRLRAELAARVQALTNCALQGEVIVVDSAARRATAALDGVVFQLQRGDLTVARPCAHCGAGRFESAPLTSRADLGHALAVWQPYHAGCEPSDPADADW
jgi:hypothetical protein